MGYDVLGYDVLGDDVEGEDMLGSPFEMVGAAAQQRGGLRNARWAQQLRRGAPGAPAISEMLLPLGLGTVTFSAGVSSAVLTATPQLAFRGERIVLSAVAGQAFTGNTLDAISVGDIKVGQRSQLVSAQNLPGSAFAATSFGVRIASDPCAPGILITLAVNYIGPALTGVETFTCTGVIFGRSAG
jgi:hypothetical protein